MNQPYASCQFYVQHQTRPVKSRQKPVNHIPSDEDNHPDDEAGEFEPAPPEDAFHEDDAGIILDDGYAPSGDGPPATWPSDLYCTEEYPGAAQTYGQGPTLMYIFDSDAYAQTREDLPYYPFASRDEWELASFLLRSDLSMSALDEFLSLSMVSQTYFQLFITKFVTS